MLLHNFCIDHRISEDTHIANGLGEVQPSRWEKAPRFDADGRPMDYFQMHNVKQPDIAKSENVDGRFERRDALYEALKRAGLERPPSSKARAAKKKKGRKSGINKKK